AAAATLRGRAPGTPGVRRGTGRLDAPVSRECYDLSMPKKPALTAIYCRISRDRDGTSLGVQRQEKLCREIVKRNGWTVFDVYVDNDVSATKRKARPDYVRMLTDLRAGAFTVVVALDTDRLLRRPLEFEQLAEVGEGLGLRIEYQNGRVNFT